MQTASTTIYGVGSTQLGLPGLTTPSTVATVELQLSVRKGIPGLPEPMQQFLVCCLLLIVVPILPFSVEYLVAGHISPETLCIGGAVYVFALGTSSRNVLYFVMCLLAGIAYTILYGIVARPNPPALAHQTPAIIAVSAGVLIVCCAIERFNRHAIECAPFLDFMKRPGDR